MLVTHFTQSRPRLSGTTSRHGAPLPAGSTTPATAVARSACSASAIGSDVDQPVTALISIRVAAGSGRAAASTAPIEVPRHVVSSAQPDVQSRIAVSSRVVEPAETVEVVVGGSPDAAPDRESPRGRVDLRRALTEERRHGRDAAARQGPRPGEPTLPAEHSVEGAGHE